MRISVIGCGHLGAVHAACLAEFGHDVLGVDIDAPLVEALRQGCSPFYEPGLDDLLVRNTAEGRLAFTTDYDEAAAFADLHYLCVGTPQRAGSEAADLSYLTAAVDALGPRLRRPAAVVGKSTVPVGTAAAIQARLRALAPVGERVVLGWSPEFLREGRGIPDTLQPDRIVVGTGHGRHHLEEVIRQACAPQIRAGVPLLVTDLATAELVKSAANAFLATKISFVNAVAHMCEQVGANAYALAEALGYDGRIGAAGLHPGVGYGGGCLPKDVRALTVGADNADADHLVGLLAWVEDVNAERRARLVDMADQACSGLDGARAAVWGAAFKPGTDDVRDSPALDVASSLKTQGADVVVFDPIAVDNARKTHPGLEYADSAAEAVSGADVLVHLTEWPEFTQQDPAVLGMAARQLRLVDGRGGLDHARWRAAGWEVSVLGCARPTS